MSLRQKACLVVATAVTCMSLTYTASANRLSLGGSSFRLTWSEWGVLGTAPLEASARCPLTLEGSFHARTFTKGSGLLIGFVNSSAIQTASCFSGTPTALTGSLPWHVRYDSFTGSLPSFTSIALQVVGLSFTWRFSEFFPNCLYRSTEAAPARWIASVESGVITRIRWDETRRIPFSSGEAPCPTGVTYSGTGEIRQQGGRASLSITLI